MHLIKVAVNSSSPHLSSCLVSTSPKGGGGNHEEVIPNTAHLKPLFLSRNEASRQLSGAGLADSASPVQDIAVEDGHSSVSAIGAAASPGSAPPSSASSRRSGSPLLLAGPHVKRPKSTAVAELKARQAAMERRTSRIEELLEQLVSQRSPAPLPLTSEGLISGFEEDEYALPTTVPPPSPTTPRGTSVELSTRTLGEFLSSRRLRKRPDFPSFQRRRSRPPQFQSQRRSLPDRARLASVWGRKNGTRCATARLKKAFKRVACFSLQQLHLASLPR